MKKPLAENMKPLAENMKPLAENILEVRGIGIEYGSITAVKEADLIVPEGKIVGLVGGKR